MQRWLTIVAFLCPLAGCAGFMAKQATNTTADVLARAVPTTNYESDPELMREAAPATLKTVEGFLAGNPDNVTLRRILAELYGEYAFGFLVSDLEQARLEGKPDDFIDHLRDRATDFFIRSFGYGLSIVDLEKDDALEKAIYGGTVDDVNRALARLDGDDADIVAGVFWTAFGLGQAIDINRDQDYLLGYMPVVHSLMQWVATNDPGFYNGAAFVGLGTIDGTQPKALGGKPDQAKAEFEKAIALTGGRFLMNKVMFAHVYAYAVQDKDLYLKTLNEVLAADLSAAPEYRLPNTLAKIRARRYLAETKDLF